MKLSTTKHYKHRVFFFRFLIGFDAGQRGDKSRITMDNPHMYTVYLSYPIIAHVKYIHHILYIQCTHIKYISVINKY